MSLFGKSWRALRIFAFSSLVSHEIQAAGTLGRKGCIKHIKPKGKDKER